MRALILQDLFYKIFEIPKYLKKYSKSGIEIEINVLVRDWGTILKGRELGTNIWII